MTRDEVQNFAAKCLAEGFADPRLFQGKLQELIEFMFSEYESMNADAKAYVDLVLERLVGFHETVAEKMSESPEKRRLLRQVALVKGKHLKAENLTHKLSELPYPDLPILKASRPAFLSVLQRILDVLHDATRKSHHGPAAFASMALLFAAVDELLAAFHLAEHSFATQAYAHVRTVFEHLDKVELFSAQPQWADVWAKGDEKTAWEELRPAAVRKKLGKPKFDEIYSFLSGIGTHGTFRAVQGRVAQRITPESDNISVTVWVGGIPRVDQIVFSVSSCIFAVVSTLIVAVGIYQNRLNEEEAMAMLKDSVEQSGVFLSEHFGDVGC